MQDQYQSRPDRANAARSSGAAPAVESEDDLDILGVLAALWRGRVTILILMFLAVLAGSYQAFTVTPKYTSTVGLTLQLRNESVVDIDSLVSGVSTDTAAINTELEVITSSELVGQMVDKLELINDPEFNIFLESPGTFSMRALRGYVSKIPGMPQPPTLTDDEETDAMRNRTIGAVRSAIRAVNQRDTYVFLIQATTTNSKKSALLANTLADLYIQDQINVKFNVIENAVGWLSERVVELEAELEEKQNSIKTLRSGMDVTTIEALEAMNQRALEIRDRLAATQTELAVQQTSLDQLLDLGGSGDRKSIAAALNDLELNRVLARLEGGDAASAARFDNRVVVLIERAEISVLRSRQQVEALQTTLEQLDSELAQKSEKLLQLQQIERETEATRTLYETFLTRLKETSVQRGLQQADSRVLSVGTPGRYVSPRKARILIFSALLGLIAGSIFTLIRQFVYQGFRTSEDLEAASNHVVMGEIPRMPIRRRQQLLEYLKSNPHSAVLEAVRNLRTSVLLSNVDVPPQIIMVTSSVPGEGKTTIAIALAHNFAGLGKRVLLVQGDLRRQNYSDYFGANEAQTDTLFSAADLDKAFEATIRHDETTGLDVLWGALAGGNAADILSSQKYRDLLSRLREQYDHIIIDTPPVLVVPDARIVGQMSDSILFIVNWNRTSRQQVSEGLRSLSIVGLNPSGMVLSQVDGRGMRRYGYSNRYGAYADYGKSYYGS